MPHTSRRSFAKAFVAASVALPALGQTQATPSPLGKALVELTRAQFGAHLNDEELALIDKDMQEYAALLERFRAFKLVNADEPDFNR